MKAKVKVKEAAGATVEAAREGAAVEAAIAVAWAAEGEEEAAWAVAEGEVVVVVAVDDLRGERKSRMAFVTCRPCFSLLSLCNVCLSDSLPRCLSSLCCVPACLSRLTGVPPNSRSGR